MARTQDLDSLSQRGTEKVLQLLVYRNARRVDDDVVGSLKEGAAALTELLDFGNVLTKTYWQSSDLAESDFSHLIEQFEPGNNVNRVGVAVYAVPLGAKKIPRDFLKGIKQGLLNSVWLVRRRTHELAAEKDLFEDQSDSPDMLDPWPGDSDSLDSATVALVRAGRRNAIFVYDMSGKEVPVDVGDVQPFPPTLVRTILIDGIVNGHRWSTSEAHILGFEIGESRKTTLAGAQRSFLIKVPNATTMQMVLKVSAARERRQWKVDQYEYVVDGGNKKIENRLAALDLPDSSRTSAKLIW